MTRLEQAACAFGDLLARNPNAKTYEASCELEAAAVEYAAKMRYRAAQRVEAGLSELRDAVRGPDGCFPGCRKHGCEATRCRGPI